MNPLVSIITPAYNCAKLINSTIESVLAQTYDNWEMLIVDDCSTDNTKEVITKWQIKDSRIKLLIQNENGGASLARNRAIIEARGKYIAFLDSDDLWLPEKLEKQVYFMESNGYVISYTPYYVIDKDFEKKKIKKAPTKVDYKDMLKYNRLGCLTVMVNIEKVGRVTISKIDKRNDYALWLKIMKQGHEAYCLNESLSIYRSHQGLSSGSKFKILKYHYIVFNRILGYGKLTSFFLMIRNGFFYVISNLNERCDIQLNEKE